jgi:predicted HicB family RNase H-like nuclease
MSVRRKAKKVKISHKKVARKSATKHKSGGDYLKFSGKFTVRLPKSLHQALVARAEREGVSLNLFVTNALSRTVAVSGKKR